MCFKSRILYVLEAKPPFESYCDTVNMLPSLVPYEFGESNDSSQDVVGPNIWDPMRCFGYVISITVER